MPGVSEAANGEITPETDTSSNDPKPSHKGDETAFDVSTEKMRRVHLECVTAVRARNARRDVELLHDRIDAIQTSVAHLGRAVEKTEQRVIRMENELGRLRHEIRDIQDQTLLCVAHLDSKMAMAASALASAMTMGSLTTLMGPSASSSSLHHPKAPAAAPAAAPRHPTKLRPELVFDHKLSRNPQSVTSMYKEWFGIGEFENIPCAGGIARVEEVQKSAWRKNYTQADKLHFSKFQRIIGCVVKRANDQQSEEADSQQFLETALSEFDALYSNQASNNVSSMVDTLVNEGLMERKQRAPKRRRDSNEA